VLRFTNSPRPLLRVGRLSCPARSKPASVEDYLQEFGRAGSDGRQSVAVTFTEGNRGSGRDVGLLKFMADKTSTGSGLDEVTAKAIRQHRYSQITDLTASTRRIVFGRA